MSSRYLITGATGFVGGHIAEAFVQARLAGQRHCPRPTSDTALLEQLKVTLHRGELERSAAGGRRRWPTLTWSFTRAAKVGDWGPVDDYRAVNVEQLRTLLGCVQGTWPCRASFTSARWEFTKAAITTAPTNRCRRPGSTPTATRKPRSSRSSWR